MKRRQRVALAPTRIAATFPRAVRARFIRTSILRKSRSLPRRSVSARAHLLRSSYRGGRSSMRVVAFTTAASAPPKQYSAPNDDACP